MRTWKSRRGTFAYLLRTFHQVIKESMFISGTGQKLLMMMEIITNSRKYTLRYIIVANSRKIELRAGYRNEYIEKIIDKECGNNYKRNLLEEVEMIHKVPHYH